MRETVMKHVATRKDIEQAKFSILRWLATTVAAAGAAVALLLNLW